MKGCTQLSQGERYQIFFLKEAEYDQARIAALPGRGKSAVGRVLRRNRGLRGYRRDCDQRGCEVAVILIIKMLNDALPPKVQVSHRLRNDRHQNATIFAGLQGRLDC